MFSFIPFFLISLINIYEMSILLQIVAWFTFVFWQPYGSDYRTNRKWYEAKKTFIMFAPPGWIFGIAWSILYGLITCSAVIFFNTFSSSIATFVLFFVNVVLNKFWSPVFFGRQWVGVALVIVICMIGTEIGVLILFGLEFQWVAFALYCPYLIWSMYALILNIQFYQLKQ